MICDKKIKTEYIGEVPIDIIESLPDYILAERDVEDSDTGNIIRTLVRVPARKLFPSINADNLFALDPNSTAITVPENQVRAVRIANNVSTPVMYYADNSHAPMMLALGEQADMMVCQNTGVVNLPEGHSYVIGAQYYAGNNGEPTTTSGNYKLFIPVSSTKLLINM